MAANLEPDQQVIDEFVGVAHGNFMRVKELLAQYPSLINANASWNETAIQAAAQVGRRDMVEYLLQAGAPLDICTAAMMGMDEQVRAMVQQDPELVAVTGAHSIPLMYYPAISGNDAIAEFLYSGGAAINSGEGGTTPLHGAVAFGQFGMARWLLEHGARLDILDMEGKTPIERAQANDNTEMVTLLKSYTA